MKKDDRRYMQMAIEQARAQAARFGLKDNADRPNPLVGCVVVTKEGKVATGYRGELEPNEHAEFTVLEKKMADDVLTGATVYTTLEPCVDRNPPKKSCAQRLIDRRVRRVVIGYMDPDDRGKGYHALADRNIDVELFPGDLRNEVMELNRFYIQSRKPNSISPPLPRVTPPGSTFQPTIRTIEQIIAYIDREREGTVQVVGILESWPDMKESCAPDPPWSAFRYVPDPTGDAEKDQEILTANGYKPPTMFTPDRNETVALFSGGSIRYSELYYYPIKYQTKLALIDEGLAPTTLSSGCLMLAPGGDLLYVHERSKRSDVVHEAHGQFHTFCGAVRCRSDSHYDLDTSLFNACIRETLEESGVVPELFDGQVAILKWRQRMNHSGKKLWHTGIDVVFLGAQTTHSGIENLKTSELARRRRPDSARWEGFVVSKSLDRRNLFDEITAYHEDWFAPGIAQILLWLGIGAPGANKDFQSHARDLLSEIIDYFRQRGYIT